MSAISRYTKPANCAGCALSQIGHGYVPGSGPISDLLFLGEAPGYEEAAMGAPFVGAAGGMHSRILRLNSLNRDTFRHENVLSCVPPGFEVKKAWAADAAHQCRGYRTRAMQEAKVIVAMGQTAIREALGLWNYEIDDVKVNNFHGTVHDSPFVPGQQIVCTFHPSFLQRGAVNLLRVVSFDIAVALECLEGTWKRDPIETIIDPPVDFVRAYIDTFKQALQHNPKLWGAADIETPDKEKGKSEDELDESSKSYQIDRINYAYHPDQGVTFPYYGDYIPLHHELLSLIQIMVAWNAEYDLKRILAAIGTGRHPSLHPQLEVYDGMWLGHHLSSNIPLGLGFWAPFHSNHGAWKHKFSTEPGYYAACDGPQELRTVRGIVRDLQAQGQWHFAYRHTIPYMQQVLKPASIIGIGVDRQKLADFEERLTTDARYRMNELQKLIPAELRPLTPKEGLSKPPQGAHPKARLVNTRTGAALADAEDRDPLKVELYTTFAQPVNLVVTRKVLFCRTCGSESITSKHRCKDKTLSPEIVWEDRQVTRYFWQEPFNPDSPPQVLAYLKAKGHKPGKDRSTKKDTTDRDTLQRLRVSTRDPFYKLLLELRAISKVRGTYAIGVRKRLDAEDRFHPTFTLRPSTLRNSAVAPNIQNVVGDNDDKTDPTQNLADGFRDCIVATDQLPAWTKGWTKEQLEKYL